MAAPAVREITARSILNRSGIADYAVNCYTGCQHGCAYCYARRMAEFANHAEEWGSFVDVKVNSVDILRRQAARTLPAEVFLSSVCDGWQPAEVTYRLTRQCLDILVSAGFRVSILTKSTLARRDFDIMKRAAHLRFGVTVTTVDEELRRMMEPRVPAGAHRLDLVKQAQDAGIRTYVCMGPLLPYLADRGAALERLVKAVAAAKPESVCVDALNPRRGVWQALVSALRRTHGCLIPSYRRILFDADARREYTDEVRAIVAQLLRAYGLLEKARVFL
mgnify:CR=1 FL=1